MITSGRVSRTAAASIFGTFVSQAWLQAYGWSLVSTGIPATRPHPDMARDISSTRAGGEVGGGDGELDQVVGEGRDPEGEREAEDGELPAVEAGVRRGGDDDDRPVPQIEAVRDAPDPDQRSRRQGGAEREPGGLHDRGDDGGDGEPEQEVAAPIHPRRAVGDLGPGPAAVGDPDRAGDADRGPR